MRVAFVSAVLLSLLSQLPASGRDIVIRFPRGSYCGSYTGNIRRGDSFRLSEGEGPGLADYQ